MADHSLSNNSLSFLVNDALSTRQTSRQITYVSAPCGSGKTYNLADFSPRPTEALILKNLLISSTWG